LTGRKVSTIYNGVVVGLFTRKQGVPEELRLLAVDELVIARNPPTLVEAPKHFFETHGWCPVDKLGRAIRSERGEVRSKCS
jgi:hypothetical protein